MEQDSTLDELARFLQSVLCTYFTLLSRCIVIYPMVLVMLSSPSYMLQIIFVFILTITFSYDKKISISAVQNLKKKKQNSESKARFFFFVVIQAVLENLKKKLKRGGEKKTEWLSCVLLLVGAWQVRPAREGSTPVALASQIASGSGVVTTKRPPECGLPSRM